MPRTLFLSGAGFNIYSLLGGVIELNQDFDLYVGTSAGAYLALALVLDWPIETMLETSSRYGQYLTTWSAACPGLLFGGSVINDTAKLASIREMIRDSPLMVSQFPDRSPDSITFADLAQVTRKQLVCNASRLTNADLEHVIFSLQTTPQRSILEAVSASMSLPLLFRPQTIKGHQYIDGALCCNFLPILFDDDHQLSAQVRKIPVDLSQSVGILFEGQIQLGLGGSAWSVSSLIRLQNNITSILVQAATDFSPGKKMEALYRVVAPGVSGIPSPTVAAQMVEAGRLAVRAQRAGYGHL